MVRRDDLMVLAVQRRGVDRFQAASELEPGDAMLVYGSWPSIEQVSRGRDVLVVDSPDLMRRQSAPLGAKARQAVAGLVIIPRVWPLR